MYTNVRHYCIWTFVHLIVRAPAGPPVRPSHSGLGSYSSSSKDYIWGRWDSEPFCV